jgi:hypothetical protein
MLHDDELEELKIWDEYDKEMNEAKKEGYSQVKLLELHKKLLHSLFATSYPKPDYKMNEDEFLEYYTEKYLPKSPELTSQQINEYLCDDDIFTIYKYKYFYNNCYKALSRYTNEICRKQRKYCSSQAAFDLHLPDVEEIDIDSINNAKQPILFEKKPMNDEFLDKYLPNSPKLTSQQENEYICDDDMFTRYKYKIFYENFCKMLEQYTDEICRKQRKYCSSQAKFCTDFHELDINSIKNATQPIHFYSDGIIIK